VTRSFRGESFHKVDAKGRVSIPASFRRVLEQGDPDWQEKLPPNLVLVYGDPGTRYLECYTMEAMAELESLIEEIEATEARDAALRIYITQSMTMEVDPTGRIVLPQMLRDRIGVEEEVVFAGRLRTFRIWTPADYRADIEARDRGMVRGDPATDPQAALDLVRRRRAQ
jgi:MraZ protein